MKKLEITALFLTCLLFNYAHAGWTDKQGNSLPNTEYRTSDGNFGAQLIFTGDPKKLSDLWGTPSETVDIDMTETSEINKPISAFIMFSGCKTNHSGNCNVSMRFRVIQPDGKIYAETPTMEVWHNKPVPPDCYVELSIQYLKLIIEPHEQLGRYTVQAQVRDDNTGTVLFLQKPFTAIDPKK